MEALETCIEGCYICMAPGLQQKRHGLGVELAKVNESCNSVGQTTLDKCYTFIRTSPPCFNAYRDYQYLFTDRQLISSASLTRQRADIPSVFELFLSDKYQLTFSESVREF